MKNIKITVLYLSEFNLWFHLGYKTISKDKLYRTKNSVEKSKFLKSIPDYEEDFEIILVEIGLNNLTLNEKLYNIPFHKIVNIYPITSRAIPYLDGRIDSRIKLSEPKFENDFLTICKAQIIRSCKEGAGQLLSALNIQSPQLSDECIAELNLAIDFRNNIPNELDPNKSFYYNLFIYDRIKPFDKSNFGYFYDLGAVLKVYIKDKPNILEKFNEYLKNLNPQKDSMNIFGMINDLSHSGELYLELKALSGEQSIIAGLLFFLLRKETRDNNSLINLNLDSILENTMLKEKFQDDFAIAVYLFGFFFGFDGISDYIYTKNIPEIFKNHPAPTQNKESKLKRVRKKIKETTLPQESLL